MNNTNLKDDENILDLLSFYKNKTVLVTGHTGFKGTWLTRILLTAGARVIGYALKPPTVPNLYSLAGFSEYKKNGNFVNVEGDVRDLKHLQSVLTTYQPSIVFHLAAQPIVRDSYKNPVYTYETNVMGTVNVLESIRLTSSVRSAVIITTDKVYKNNEWIWGYREDEPLDGFDPYSNSKSCAELSVHSYRNSFFNSMDGTVDPTTGEKRRYVAVSTARAGNVIGGGDFANDRIIPDCIRSLEEAIKDKKDIAVIGVRNPYSTRPYQHVLEPLAMYLTIAARQWNDRVVSSYYNVGPDDEDCVTTGDLVSLFCSKWNELVSGSTSSTASRDKDRSSGQVTANHTVVLDKGSRKDNSDNIALVQTNEVATGASGLTSATSSNILELEKLPHARWESHAEKGAPHEANFLKLDSTKIKVTLGYHPRWHIVECMNKTVEFSAVYLLNPDSIPFEMDKEIKEFFSCK